MLQIKKFEFNPFAENTYIIWDETTNQAAVIDPGCIYESEEIILDDFIASGKLVIKYIINTHCHLDHIFGNAYIKQKYGAELLAAREDEFLIGMLLKQAAGFGLTAIESPLPDKYLDENMKIEIGDSEGKFLFTPGHSPGGYCIYFPQNNFCITGDVLFRDGIGRSDLWGGDSRTLMKSIADKLLTLPDSVTIFPGHGEKSTIGFEKLNNSFLL